MAFQPQRYKFAMSDFGAQDETHPYNVGDLNNLQTHQSSYTALSCSASAKGTLILQGFNLRRLLVDALGLCVKNLENWDFRWDYKI